LNFARTKAFQKVGNLATYSDDELFVHLSAYKIKNKFIVDVLTILKLHYKVR